MNSQLTVVFLVKICSAVVFILEFLKFLFPECHNVTCYIKGHFDVVPENCGKQSKMFNFCLTHLFWISRRSYYLCSPHTSKIVLVFSLLGVGSLTRHRVVRTMSALVIIINLTPTVREDGGVLKRIFYLIYMTTNEPEN